MKTQLKKHFYVYVYLDPRKPGIYQYHNKIRFDHEPIYVGKGSNGQYLRHLNEAKGSDKSHTHNPYKLRKIKKILKAGLEPIIIKYKENIFESSALRLESMLIKLIGRDKIGPLTNLTSGGEGISGYQHTDESKKKIGIASLGNTNTLGYHHTIEAKEKIGNAHSGENNIWYGIGPNSGKKASLQTRKKQSLAQKKRFESEDQWSKGLTGPKHPNYGRILTTEHKQKISKGISKENNPSAKKYKVISPDNTEYFCHGNLKTLCSQCSFSYNALLVTSRTGKPISRGNGKGWIAVLIP